jgi:flotillin
MEITVVIIVAIAGALGILAAIVKGLIFICAPNEVLIFSGTRRMADGRSYGYRLVKGGRSLRKPMIERVDKMDLTNMVIDLTATNAYSKGGIPLTVQGVANVKVAGHEPLLNHAIERFLGRSREQIGLIAKATLEGSLRSILATMTPEQVNEDKILFAEKLVQEVEQDMTSLGLVVDTLKIQNVQDDVQYLNSIGRKKSAEVICKARVAEAIAKADAVVNAAENLQKEVTAQITAQIDVTKADAQKRLTEALTRRVAVVAEEQSLVAAQVAKSRADVDVQKARVEQIRRKLEADVIQPAKANCEAAEVSAKASTAKIIEDGRARADALKSLAEQWKQAGPKAREVLLMQKLEPIVEAVSGIVAETKIDKFTMIDSKAPGLGGDGNLPARALSTLEQIKQIFGVDVVEKIKALQAPGAKAAPEKVQLIEPKEEPAPTPAPAPAPKPSAQTAPKPEPKVQPKVQPKLPPVPPPPPVTGFQPPKLGG